MNQFAEILGFFQEIGADFLQWDHRSPPVDLKVLNQEITSCTKCDLHKSKTKYVPGEGSPTPDIVFIGEGPGETEDRFGRPFIGKAGQLLDKIIERMGYHRESVFIGNIVKCRPPGNRDPLKEEVNACLPYLKRQIAILRPKVIVCLGKVAMNNLLDADYSITRSRGKLFEFEGIPVIPTFHPSYVLHQRTREKISKAKWDIWSDMEKVLSLMTQS